MFEESIGTLNQGFTFSYKYLDNTIIEENNLNAYQMGECISIGGFSKVYMVRSKKSGSFYIGKFIDKNMSDDSKFIDLVLN